MSDKGSNIKSRLPSRHVSVGPKSAPHRSMYYAMGMTEEQIYQPFVGVATTWNESAPCNITDGYGRKMRWYTCVRMNGECVPNKHYETT